jgi:hypothetical protein
MIFKDEYGNELAKIQECILHIKDSMEIEVRTASNSPWSRKP